MKITVKPYNYITHQTEKHNTGNLTVCIQNLCPNIRKIILANSERIINGTFPLTGNGKDEYFNYCAVTRSGDLLSEFKKKIKDLMDTHKVKTTTIINEN